MKRIIYLISIALLAVGVTSCELETDPKSSADQEAVFSIYGLAEKAVIGIYETFGQEQSYRGRYLLYYGMNSDIEWMNNMDPNKLSDRKHELVGYAATPTNSEMNSEKNAWAMMYQGIERANLCIEGLRKDGNVENDADMAYLLGEALTLRALLHHDLIKGWGDVPARFSPVKADNIYMARTDRDEIYKQLLADLKEAEEIVPWAGEVAQTQTTERVNKAFVKGLRARIALHAGGYSQRMDGTVRKSNDPELESTKMYELAKQECIEIIESGSQTLGTFLENFQRICKENTTVGAESIWEIPFADGRGRVMYNLGVEHKSKDQYTGQPKGGVNGPLPYLFYDYDMEDVRRDITCVPYQWSNEENSIQELRSAKSWCFGKLRYEWMDRYVTSTNDDGVNWQYMRLAEIYMMAAEAVNEIDGPSAAAQYLAPIVERALPADKASEYMAAATATKESFFDAIVEQNAFEFAGESLRKADLIRWNLLKVKLDEAKEKMTRLSNLEGEYADLPIYLYWENQGEDLIIYGLNHGDSDEEGEALGYASRTRWFGIDDKGVEKLPLGLIDAIYQNNPDENQYWPIWQYFIDNSNGMLTN